MHGTIRTSLPMIDFETLSEPLRIRKEGHFPGYSPAHSVYVFHVNGHLQPLNRNNFFGTVDQLPGHCHESRVKIVYSPNRRRAKFCEARHKPCDKLATVNQTNARTRGHSIRKFAILYLVNKVKGHPVPPFVTTPSIRLGDP